VTIVFCIIYRVLRNRESTKVVLKNQPIKVIPDRGGEFFVGCVVYVISKV